jgi:integrase
MKIKTAPQTVSAPAGVHGAGKSLYLKKPVDDPGSGSWIFRYRLDGKRREMGLGALADVSLADARARAERLRVQCREGRDPIDERKDRRRKAKRSASRAQAQVTFRQAVESYLKAHGPSWKHRRAQALWLNPLIKYAYPVIGGLGLNVIAIEHVEAILAAAAAADAPEAGRRVRSRIEAVLNAAIAKGWRDAARGNPANGKLIAAVFPSKRKAGDRRHYRRIALEAAPAAFSALKERAAASSTFAAWAFMALTAARPSEALGTQWREVDLERALWTVPATRMKGGREHVVPLSSAALGILELQRERRTGDAVFPGRGGSVLAYSGFADAPMRASLDVGSPHSWRSIFRDCCGDRLRVDRDLAEAALAHSLGGVEGAYRRETAIEARRPVMEAFAHWLTGADRNVIEFRPRG